MACSSFKWPDLRIMIVSLLAGLIGHAPLCSATEDAPERAALEFIIAAFYARDADEAIRHLADNVQRGREQGEEVIEGLRREIERAPAGASLTLKQIRFFERQDVQEVAKAFEEQSRNRVDWPRLEEKLSDAKGCLFLFEPGENEDSILILVVLKQIQGEYKIVYTDDN